MKPRILLTNDDGIRAEGIKHLFSAVQDKADISIIAPDRERSGAALSITWNKPLVVNPFHWDLCKKSTAWSLSGTPADCVKIGCSSILKEPPHIVLSGINRGSNSGRTVLYSGTVGAIIESTLRGIPGIAFSYSDFEIPKQNVVSEYIYPLVDYVLQNPLPKGTFLNVTFPKNVHLGVKGFKMTRQGKGYWTERPDKRVHPEGAPYYWLGGQWSPSIEHEESEITLLEQGFITAVPLHVDELTDLSVLEGQKAQMEALFSPKFNARVD